MIEEDVFHEINSNIVTSEIKKTENFPIFSDKLDNMKMVDDSNKENNYSLINERSIK